MTLVRSLKDGATPDDRVLLELASTAVPNVDPVTNLGINLQGASFLHVYVELPGTMSELRITPWYFSPIPEQWFEGDQIIFQGTPNPDTKFSLVQTEGEERVFFVADAVTGTGTFKLWAGYSQTGVLGSL